MLKTHTHTPPNLVPVRRALLSVSDKSGIVEFASRLSALGVELISTGGTAKAISGAGLRVTSIEAITGFPEMMDGRVKTLHPKIHGGLLGVRDDPEHAAAMRDHGIAPIDLVCINLYPFERTIARAEVTRAEAIENIDIGGPSMVRSAAKNSDYVLVLTDASQYERVIRDLEMNSGSSTLDLRRSCAAAAFAVTASYDAAVAEYLARVDGRGSAIAGRLELTPLQSLRYGENPHQSADLYAIARGSRLGGVPLDPGAGVPQSTQLHGKELSYNNINDAAAALSLVASLASLREAGGVASAVIKHANPCGAAVAGSCAVSAHLAIQGDPLAAYGGILAISAPLDLQAAQRLCARDAFFEVVIAPGYAADALAALKERWANLRILEAPSSAFEIADAAEFRSVPGGVLVQRRDTRLASADEFRHAAGPAPTREQLAIAAFLEPVCRALTSNAVCVGGLAPEPGAESGSDGGSGEDRAGAPRAMRLFGAGAGQMDRLASCRLALAKAGDLARGAVAFSDAFFPFDDGPRALIDGGVTCLVHPGGSKRDQDTFDLCNARGVTCLTTGVRHFRH